MEDIKKTHDDLIVMKNMSEMTRTLMDQQLQDTAE